LHENNHDHQGLRVFQVTTRGPSQTRRTSHTVTNRSTVPTPTPVKFDDPDLDPRTQYIVDGTLLPCWSWHGQRQLHSGKHRTTGLNVQVACDLHGRLAWISDPVDGCRHDSAALKMSGVLDTLDPGNWMGDKGYVGNDMITPIKKPACRKLLDWEKEFNRDVNKVRYLIERTIANLKTWRILHTDYRRPLATFTTTISTVIALHFYAISPE